MDLLEFAVDFSVLFDVLVLIVVLSFFVERALSVVFESAFFIAWYHPEFHAADNPTPEAEDNADTTPKKPRKKKKGIKEMIAIILSVVVVYNIDFNALAILMKNENVSQELGYFITGLIIAGGSKASIKLFNDILDFRSSAESRRKEFDQRQRQ